MVSDKKLHSAAKKAKTQLIRAKKAIVSAEKKVRAYATTNPRKAMAIAAGVGAVLGGLAIALARRKRR